MQVNWFWLSIKKNWYLYCYLLLLLLLCPFLVDSGRMFGLVYSPWERVTTSHQGSQVSLFPFLTGTVLSLVPLLYPTMLFSGQLPTFTPIIIIITIINIIIIIIMLLLLLYSEVHVKQSLRYKSKTNISP